MQCSAAPGGGGLYGVSHEVLRYHGAAMSEVLPARRNGEMGEIWHGWVRELMLRSAIHEPSSRAALRIHKQRYFVPAYEHLSVYSCPDSASRYKYRQPTSGTASPLLFVHQDKSITHIHSSSRFVAQLCCIRYCKARG